MDIVDKPFVTQEQKFEYWQASKAEIKSLRNQLAKCQKNAERYEWILDNCKQSGGGHGIEVTFFVPVDHEDLNSAISQAMSEKAISEHVCEECGAATHPYAMGNISGWACSSCGWSQDD